MKKLLLLISLTFVTFFCYSQIATGLNVFQANPMRTGANDNLVSIVFDGSQYRMYRWDKWGVIDTGRLATKYDLLSYVTIPSMSNGLASKMDNPSGSLSQYIRGNGSLANFPTNVSSFSNDAGYLTSFIELDPTVPSYAKGLSAFSVIKASTDVLYKGIGYSPSSGEIISALGYTPYNGTTNPNGYISGVPAQSFASLTGKPTTLSGYGITDAATSSALTSGLAAKQNLVSLTTTGSGAATFNQSTGALNIPTGTSYTAGTGIGISSGVITNTAPDQTVSISGGTSIGVSGTYPSFTINNNAPYVAPVISTPTMVLGTSYQAPSNKNVWVNASITHTIALTLLLSSGSSSVQLQTSPNNSTWTTINSCGFSDAVAVAVALNKTVTNNVSGEVPPNFYYRLVATTSGAGSAAIVNQQIKTY